MSRPGQDEDDSATILRRPDAALRRPTHEIVNYIIVLEGSESGKKLELGLKPVRIGRKQDNDLSLADPFVSGHHCTVAFESGLVRVTDPGSTNGTYIDGKRISGRATWPDNAPLQIGNQILCHEYRARDELERSTQLAVDVQQAAEYVRSLLPPPVKGGPVATDWRYAPCAELGGDIFDHYWLDGSRFVFYLIDVCGHGIGAALHSVSVSNLLRQRSLADVDFARPAKVLDALNRMLPMEQYGSMYFTIWYGVYHAGTRQLGYASAGHPPALLFSENGRGMANLATDNPPVGILENIEFEEAAMGLDPASSLYVYSDGVFEISRRGGDWWSREAFARLLQQEIQAGAGQTEEIYRTILGLTQTGRFEDDFTLVRMSFGG